MASGYEDINTRPPARWVAVLALGLALLPGRLGAAAWGQAPAKPATPEFVAGEEKARAQVAKPWIAFATWCLDHRQKTAGQKSIDEALTWDPRSGAAKDLKKALDALAADGPEDPQFADRQHQAGEAAAKALDRLLELKSDDKSAPRFEDYLFLALELDPGNKRRLDRLGTMARQAVTKGRFDPAGRLLGRARQADPEGWAAGRYRDAWLDLARKDVAIAGAGESPFVASVALPEDWSPKGRYVVLVAVEGAGCNFLGAARHFRGARGKRPLIVVVPHSLTNTNQLDPAKYPFYSRTLLADKDGNRMRFDAQGLEAVLGELQKSVGAEPRWFMTGFSGGGQLTYWWLFQRPKNLLGAVPACGNFGGTGIDGATPPEDGGPPVHILTGDKDEFNDEVFGQKPGIQGQSDLAEEHLKRLGYSRLRRTRVPGVGHSNMADQVYAFIDEVLAGQ